MESQSKTSLHTKVFRNQSSPSKMAETHTFSVMLLFFLDYLLLTNSKGKIIWGNNFSLCRKMCTCWSKVCYLHLLVSFSSFVLSPVFVLHLKLVKNSFLSKVQRWNHAYADNVQYFICCVRSIFIASFKNHGKSKCFQASSLFSEHLFFKNMILFHPQSSTTC